MEKKNRKDKLEQIEEAEAVIEASALADGLLSSASAVRDFLVDKFDEVLGEE